ncbi:MAG: SUMF1/EgtB/PvdO family nonheme iron enzyme [Thermodesulfobacteriota bacterium]
MANSSISLQGIDQAIADLKYRPGSVKQKTIMAIRAFYLSDESIKELDSIDTDTLIKSIWDIGDNFSKIKSKRRNFSSLRSSINADLKQLLKKEKNPENIIIADSNLFDLNRETKENLLGSFSDICQKRELSEQFDKKFGKREKKYNKYTKIPRGLYSVGTEKSITSTLELQQFDMPEVYIGIYPVINSLFEIFIKETGYITSAEKLGFGRVYYLRFKKDASGSKWNKYSGSEDVKGACWYQPTGPDSSLHGKQNHPVVQVSVDDALTFASWIERRIPTEAEWESAARTDLGYKYPWGNEFNQKALNLEQSGLSDTSPVDDYENFANKFKVIDMLGNVMEWTSDMDVPSFKSNQNTRYSVAKGGAWNARDGVSISSRALFKPGFTSNIIGFRCISNG